MSRDTKAVVRRGSMMQISISSVKSISISSIEEEELEEGEEWDEDDEPFYATLTIETDDGTLEIELEAASRAALEIVQEDEDEDDE
jgi:hypothetical protein